MTNTSSPVDQAEPQSIEERIYSKFDQFESPPEPEVEGNEPEAEEVEATPEPSDDDVEVEYDGERFRVPKKLEKAIMQERDYTRKTQEVAEERRRIEQSQATLNLSTMEREFAQSVAAESAQLAQLESYLQSVNWQELNDLPVDESIKTFMQVQRAKDMRDSIQKGVEGKRTQFMREFESAVEAHREKVLEQLPKALPGFTREAVKTMRDYARTQGFTDAAFDNIALDAKSMAVVYKAAQYDKLQADKVTSLQKATPTVKPGASNPMPQQVRDKLAFNKAMKSAKTSHDKARLIEARLAGEF
jgi:hypothetical protein